MRALGRSTGAIAALAACVAVAHAKTSWVATAYPLGPVTCFSFSPGWVADTTAPCRDLKLPEIIAVGETFSAGGVIHTIEVIRAMWAEDSVPELGIVRGQWTCAAAESPEDLEEGDRRAKAWLFIANCAPSPYP